jgi:hypothetical protein
MLMERHRLLFNNYIATCCEEMYGKARLYEFRFSEVTFARLSEKVKLKALYLGFSPPVMLEIIDDYGYQYSPDSESCLWICKSLYDGAGLLT